jgi:hypothetical protein
MSANYNLDWYDAEADVLAERLRRLEWPSVDNEVRDRCWEQFNQRMASLDGETTSPERARARVGDRYTCSRRILPTGGLIAGGRLAAAQTWARTTPGGIFGHARAFA